MIERVIFFKQELFSKWNGEIESVMILRDSFNNVPFNQYSLYSTPDQITLSQSGRQMMLTTYYLILQILKLSYGPVNTK